MKILIKSTTYHFGLTFFILLTAFILDAGCAISAPDPLAGWQIAFKEEPNQAIEKDCQDYMQKLPSEEKQVASWGHYYKSENGQHAVVIEIALNGRWWNYILIYNKDDARIKVIKYSPGKYRS